MWIIAWVVFGLIAGAIAKFLMPGKDPGGCIVTSLLGIGGAIVGGFIGVQLGFGTVHGFDLRSFGLAIGGAMLLLLVHRMMKRREPPQ